MIVISADGRLAPDVMNSLEPMAAVRASSPDAYFIVEPARDRLAEAGALPNCSHADWGTVAPYGPAAPPIPHLPLETLSSQDAVAR